MIATLLAVLGAVLDAVLLGAFAVGGPLLALHDRIPARLNCRVGPDGSDVAGTIHPVLAHETASAPDAAADTTSDQHRTAIAA